VTVCDFAFATPDSLFGYPEVKIGFVPSLVSVFLSEQIGQAISTELLISGELISAAKAAKIGLITEVVEQEFLGKRANEFAQKLVVENSGFSMFETKRLLRSVGAKARHEALDLAAEVNAKARSHQDFVKGIAAFLSKSKPSW
jgi:methylglutaconyl-CoA hydratase